MSDVDDDQDWLKIEPADEPDDESYKWILIQHDWVQEEEEEEEGENSSEEEEEDYEAFIEEEEEDDGLFFWAEPEQEGEEERKELLEVIKHQVLPRLPAKSVLRLKSTSRQWSGYISSPLFVHTHSQLRRRSLSGMFFHSPSGAPSFAAFDGDPSPLPDPSLSFLPEPVHVVASAGGLLCCRGRRSASYYVCNPMLPSEWALLPPPTLGGSRAPDPAVALVMQEPSAYNFRADYHVVIAHEVLEGVYAFESFSSAAAGGAGWRRSNEIAAAERIVTGSVVSTAGCAYWRTTMQSVVCYNPETDASHTVPGPTAAAWEIGELGRRLCCVSVEWDAAEVRVLEDAGSEPRWRKVEEFAVEAAAAWEAEEGGAVPLRTQSIAEAVVWEGRSGLVVAHDLSTGGKRVLVDSAAPGYCADFLPYVSSLVHVHRYQ